MLRHAAFSVHFQRCFVQRLILGDFSSSDKFLDNPTGRLVTILRSYCPEIYLKPLRWESADACLSLNIPTHFIRQVICASSLWQNSLEQRHNFHGTAAREWHLRASLDDVALYSTKYHLFRAWRVKFVPNPK